VGCRASLGGCGKSRPTGIRSLDGPDRSVVAIPSCQPTVLDKVEEYRNSRPYRESNRNSPRHRILAQQSHFCIP